MGFNLGFRGLNNKIILIPCAASVVSFLHYLQPALLEPQTLKTILCMPPVG